MAITPGVQAGKTPYQIGGATGIAPVRYGNSAGAAVTSAVSSTITLPTDPQGNAYAAYRLSASASVWVGWGSGPATATGSNEWIMTGGSVQDLVPPPGTTQVSFIPADAVTAASMAVTGLY
jgi:hypothetical protein